MIRERGISKFPIVFPISGSKIEYESAEDEIKESSSDENDEEDISSDRKNKSKSCTVSFKDTSNVSKIDALLTRWSKNVVFPNSEPISYFRYFFRNNLLELIDEESSRCAVQLIPTKPLTISKNEPEQVMSRNRFEQIKKFLYCNDNMEIPANCEHRL